MARPIINILDASANTVKDWYAGKVKAGSESNIKEIYIWNNKGGVVAVDDLREGYITCLDGNGEKYGDIPMGKWLNVLVDSTAEKDPLGNKIYSAVGGAQTRPLRGQMVDVSLGNVIKGVSNDGTLINAGANYCKCNLKFDIPVNAKVATHQYKIEIGGYFI